MASLRSFVIAIIVLCLAGFKVSTSSTTIPDLSKIPTIDEVVRQRIRETGSKECPDKQFFLFMLSVIATFMTIAASVLLYRLCIYCFGTPFTEETKDASEREYYAIVLQKGERNLESKRKSLRLTNAENISRKHSLAWATEAKDFATEIISGQTLTGKIIVVLVFLFSMVSCFIYLVDTSSGKTEICEPFYMNHWQQADVFANLFFTLYFMLRFVAAKDKLRFLLELYSIVDFFTIPPTFLAVYLDRTWLGFRYLRAVRIMSLPDILHYFYILRTATSVRLAQLITILVSIWLTSAGIVHLLENSGDPLDFSNAVEISYWECLYFLTVTMATVGYGDISCRTTLGKVFIVLFILVALAVFASCIPEIIELVGSAPKFAGNFLPLQGKRHIVVCGYIIFQNVCNFVDDILHENRENAEVQIVLLDSNIPEWNLEAFIKHHYLSVEFFQGSVLDSRDLIRVKVDDALSCIVISSKSSEDPDAEDAASIMRIISIKKHKGDIRVIVQLISARNKLFLLNIPSWNVYTRDDVICFNELKLGLIAQSCLAPGFSTMMANLFTMRSYKKKQNEPLWKTHYLYGAGMEIVTEFLSASFSGMSFAEVAEFCFVKLQILLVAIGIDSFDEGFTIDINPKKQYRIRDGTLGFFIVQRPEDVKRALWYCSICHHNVRLKDVIKKCKCKAKKSRLIITVPDDGNLAETANETSMTLVEEGTKQSDDPQSLPSPRIFYKMATTKEFDGDKPDTKLDSTGLFYWQPARPLSECILDRKDASMSILNGHIILCIFAVADSPLLQMRNFVMPLRTSNLPYEELKHIVIVGDINYIEKEWRTLQNFPKISVFNGSPLSRGDLNALNINLCDMCVILSAKIVSSADVNLADKEVILANINIRGMTFDSRTGPVCPRTQGETAIQRGSNVPLLTELRFDTNARFLNLDQEDEEGSELYMTKPFACGSVFAVSVLDSLMSTTFFNSDALLLIRTMVLGGATQEQDKILAQGGGLTGPSTEHSLNRDRCRLSQVSLFDGLFTKYRDGSKYGDFFVNALRNHGMLCLGVYRLLSETGIHDTSNVRFVITNPPYDFTLLSSDSIFVLRPLEPSEQQKPEAKK